ncbi:MAG TPA: septum formation initiator family protein [Bacillota bacterium]|nr:septum formation initiator family protein [Bacillota bacterium]
MILARESLSHYWDGKRASMTAGELFNIDAHQASNPFALLVALVAVLCVLGLGHIALSHTISVHSKQLEALQHQAAQLRSDNDKLAAGIHKAVQLDKMEELARVKLKMVKPEPHQILLFNPE